MISSKFPSSDGGSTWAIRVMFLVGREPAKELRSWWLVGREQLALLGYDPGSQQLTWPTTQAVAPKSRCPKWSPGTPLSGIGPKAAACPSCLVLSTRRLCRAFRRRGSEARISGSPLRGEPMTCVPEPPFGLEKGYQKESTHFLGCLHVNANPF